MINENVYFVSFKVDVGLPAMGGSKQSFSASPLQHAKVRVVGLAGVRKLHMHTHPAAQVCFLFTCSVYLNMKRNNFYKFS